MLRVRFLWPTLVALFWAQAATAQSVTWTLSGTPDRVQAGPTTPGTAADVWVSPNPAANSPWGIAFNRNDAKVYWTDLISRQITRASLDGSGFDVAFSYSTAAPASLAIDSAGAQAYFEAGAGAASTIIKSSLDGSVQSTFATHGSGTNAWLTIDPVGRFLYWSDTSNNLIRRANLDGTTTIQNVVDISGITSHSARGVALDGAGGLYWVDNGTKLMYRADLTGYSGTPIVAGAGNQIANLSTIVGATSTPNGLASDGTWLYWTEGASGLRGVYRVRTDGTNGGLLYAAGGTVASPIGVTVAVPEPGTIFLIGSLGAGVAGDWWRKRRMPASVRPKWLP